jgi:2-dehydropantoate 2-reductase
MAIGEFAKGLPGRSQELAKMFAAAKIETVVERNVEETAWKKLIWNVPFNGLAIAEGGKTTDQLLADDSVTREIRCLMEEVLAAAASRGFTLGRSLIDWNIDRTRNMGAYRPSSLIDWQEGRDVEVEAIWAEPLRRAESTGACLPHWIKLLERIRDACDQA